MIIEKLCHFMLEIIKVSSVFFFRSRSLSVPCVNVLGASVKSETKAIKLPDESSSLNNIDLHWERFFKMYIAISNSNSTHTQKNMLKRVWIIWNYVMMMMMMMMTKEYPSFCLCSLLLLVWLVCARNQLDRFFSTSTSLNSIKFLI